MKRRFLLLIGFIAITAWAVNAQQDTITGWNFSDSASFNADMGLSGNLGYDIRAEDTGFNGRPKFYAPGVTGFAAAAAGWDNGADVKFWSIKFKANGYINMHVSSRQSSDTSMPGPRDWKLQCQLSGQPWEDITGGTVTATGDWTGGVVTNLALPATMDNPGTTSCYIRWIMTSNTDVYGGTVDTTGIALIDDILVTGENSAGITRVLYQDGLSIYPNPAGDFLNFESVKNMSLIEVYDLRGALVISQEESGVQSHITISQLEPGLYCVKTYFENTDKTSIRKIIVE